MSRDFENEKQCNCTGGDHEETTPGIMICLECGRQWGKKDEQN